MAEFQKTTPFNTGRTWIKKGHIPANKANGTISVDGYRVMSRRNKRILQHHLVWMKANQIGTIPRGMVIHHINGNRLDNRQENLTLLPIGYHLTLHRTIKNSQGRLKLPEV